jgi:hypothetical protein
MEGQGIYEHDLAALGAVAVTALLQTLKNVHLPLTDLTDLHIFLAALVLVMETTALVSATDQVRRLLYSTDTAWSSATLAVFAAIAELAEVEVLPFVGMTSLVMVLRHCHRHCQFCPAIAENGAGLHVYERFYRSSAV